MGLSVAGRAEVKRCRRVLPLTVADAYAICVLAPRAEIQARLAETDHVPIVHLMLDAAARQSDGDVIGAEARLRRAVDRASPAERAYPVDLLAPLLLAQHLYARAGTLVAGTLPADPTMRRLEAARAAVLTLVDSAVGDPQLARARAAQARTMLSDAGGAGDRLEAMRVLERLGRAAICRGQLAEAADELGAALRIAHSLRGDRAAAALHDALQSLHRTGTGDARRAWAHVLAQQRDAERGGDIALARAARALRYELAAERGVSDEVDAARTALDVEPLPERYRSRFARILADALSAGWRDDFAAARDALAGELTRPGRTDGERGVAQALFALTATALGQDALARRHARRAIALDEGSHAALPADELRRRRLARALGVLAGKISRSATRSDREVLAAVAPHAGGYARFVQAVRRRLARRPTNGPLTGAETEVLRLIARGQTAPQIATLLGRSAHTVRTHVRNIGMKLETHARSDAVARARELGILAPP